jgi:hypothetical protein
MFGSSKEIAIAIPLKVWQDPQGNPLLIYSERICEIFVGCWEEEGTPADYICKIKFNSGWASRSYRIEYLPYEIKEYKRSAILEIENSKWLKESSDYRSKCYPEWKTWDKKNYRHFVVQGHDEFVEILAESYEEEMISLKEAEKQLPLNYLEYFNQ